MEEDEFELELDDPQQFQQRHVRAYLASALTNVSKRDQMRAESAHRVIASEFRSSRHANFFVYDPADHTAPGSAHSANDVYLINFRETISADVVLLHIFAPSIGLGVEAQLAAEASLPRVIVHRRKVPISRMLVGMPTQTLATIAYDNSRDLRATLRDALPEIAKEVIETIPKRRQLLEATRAEAIGRFVVRMRIKRRITRQKLAEMMACPTEWVNCIEEFPEFAVHLNVLHAQTLACSLQCKYVPRENGVLAMIDDSNERPSSQGLRDSLDSLVDFVLQRRPRSETRVFDMWRDWSEMHTQAVAGRQEVSETMSIDDWEDLYGVQDVLF